MKGYEDFLRTQLDLKIIHYPIYAMWNQHLQTEQNIMLVIQIAPKLMNKYNAIQMFDHM